MGSYIKVQDRLKQVKIGNTYFAENRLCNGRGHGLNGEPVSYHPLYDTWRKIIYRTTNEKSKVFYRYGGRGIGVCESWVGKGGFEIFVKDMGEKPSEKHSIERIDNNAGYCPENCVWASNHQQNANKRNSNSIIGVFFNKKRGLWESKIKYCNKCYYLGSFILKDDAILARKEAESRFGITYQNAKK